MDLVNRSRRFDRISGSSLHHPIPVSPGVVKVPDDGSRAWRLLLEQSDRIGLIDTMPVMVRLDVKLVERAFVGCRDESLPDTRIPPRMEWMRLRMPLVKAADHGYRARIGSPHAEACPRLASRGQDVCTQLVVDPIVAALVEKVEVVVSQQ